MWEKAANQAGYLTQTHKNCRGINKADAGATHFYIYWSTVYSSYCMARGQFYPFMYFSFKSWDWCSMTQCTMPPLRITEENAYIKTQDQCLGSRWCANQITKKLLILFTTFFLPTRFWILQKKFRPQIYSDFGRISGFEPMLGTGRSNWLFICNFKIGLALRLDCFYLFFYLISLTP